jgi:hypothetical protein
LKNEEISKLFNTYDRLKLNQEDIYYLNTSITRNEIEIVIKNLPTKKSPGPEGFTAGIPLQTLEEELTPVIFKLFHKIQSKRLLSNLVYKASTTLISKPG